MGTLGERILQTMMFSENFMKIEPVVSKKPALTYVKMTTYNMDSAILICQSHDQFLKMAINSSIIDSNIKFVCISIDINTNNTFDQYFSG